jgi:PAS domain S-box-containing protein
MGNGWQETSSATDRPARCREFDPPLYDRHPGLIDAAWVVPDALCDTASAPTEIRSPDAFTAFDALPTAVVRTDASGIVTGWNHAAERLFGYTPREALGTRLPMVLPEEEERFEVFLNRTMHGETIAEIEVERLDNTGAGLTLLLSATPWREQGEIAGVLMTFADLSHQKERERELERQAACTQRRAWDAAYLAAVAAGCVTAADERTLLQAFAECTAQWADSAGIALAGELVAYASRIPHLDGPLAALFQACATGLPGLPGGDIASGAVMPRVHFLREVPLGDATLPQGYHTLASAPILVGNETVATLYTAARGVTPSFDTGALAAIQQAAAQVGTAIGMLRERQAVQARVDVLEAEARRKDDFLATVSHELRTPLTAILGFAHIIVENDGLGADRRRGMAEDIVASGGLLLTQVNDLLDIVQLGTGRLTVASEIVDLPAVLHWCERAVRSLMNTKELRFDLAIPAALPPVRANASRLQQVLLNFLVNAYKFTPPGGTVTLEASAGDGTVSISVRDTGIGIAPEHAARIFEPFERVVTEYTRTQSGAGVGLAVARQLVDIMGGAITLESVPDVGSAFTVTLNAE